MTARTVRDKFARLSQMATLLTLESVRGDKGRPRVLTPARQRSLPVLGQGCRDRRPVRTPAWCCPHVHRPAIPQAHVQPTSAVLFRPLAPNPLLPPWCSLLRCLQVGEVLDYWGDAGAIAWRLTDNDVRQTLSQRVDFSPNEILSLKL